MRLTVVEFLQSSEVHTALKVYTNFVSLRSRVELFILQWALRLSHQAGSDYAMTLGCPPVISDYRLPISLSTSTSPYTYPTTL